MNLKKFATAIETGDSATVQFLIDNEFVDVNARLRCAFRAPPALVLAVFCQQLKIVKILLRAGARIDDTNDHYETACHFAAKIRNLDFLTCLLTYRPNLALKDANNNSAIHYAFSVDNDGAFLMLMKAGASLDGLDLCRISVSSVANLLALQERGIVISDLRSPHSSGTPLHEAIYFKFLCGRRKVDWPLLKMLLYECKVDLEQPDINGYTCAHIASLHNDAIVLEWFIQAGANVNACCASGRTILCTVRDYDCAIALLAAGADVNMLNFSPIHRAFFNHQWPVACAMLAANPNLDVVDSDGRTVRQELIRYNISLDSHDVEKARRDIAKKRLDFVRYRALDIGIGLQPLKLPALLTCEILLFACGPIAPLISFHDWWKML